VRLLLLLMVSVIAATAQCQSTSSTVAAQDPSDELGKLKKNCPFKHVMGCAEVLFTGQPVHVAVGTLAPQNGIGVGVAYVGHKTTENWRNSWNADGVGSTNGSWRAGFYVKFVDSRQPDIDVRKGTKGLGKNATELPEQPVFNLYLQTVSLNKLSYFGVGPDTALAGRSFYGMTETILGASAVKPFSARWHTSGYTEINGRWVEIRPSHGEASPSIEAIYNESTAPGLTSQPFFMQLGVGIRTRPAFKNDLVRLNYDIAYKPFISLSDTRFSFQRFTADLLQQISLYRRPARAVRDANGPDDCAIDGSVSHPVCPKVTTRDLEGSFSLRVFMALSMTPGNDAVPFYFQPTLGGGDINGDASLASYPDYRFRAPNVLLFRETFEHSIGKLPLGFTFLADQGNLTQLRGELASSHWKHSFATGLTLRAGGFPEVYLLFAWGGREGTHTIVNVNPALLGGSSRPSLF
jgi:hypothetical protein